MEITREQYEAAIPKCCAYQTMEAHEEIMLCWGLASAVEKGKEMNCSGCTERKLKTQPMGWSASNGELDRLISDFDSIANIKIEFGDDLTLDILRKKSEEIENAIKQLKMAKNIVAAIHNVYTLELEKHGV